MTLSHRSLPINRQVQNNMKQDAFLKKKKNQDSHVESNFSFQNRHLFARESIQTIPKKISKN